MKKLSTLFCALLLLFCAACTPEAAVPPSDALTILGKRSDLDRTYLKRIFELYKNETGKEINLIKIDDEKYEDEAQARFERGEIPDVFLHFNNSDLHRFDVENNFVFFDEESWKSDLTQGALSYCMGEEGLLGLPFWESSVSGCYYNKTLLEEFGLGPASTQEEFDGLCTALKEIGKVPILWPFNGCSWMFQFGLDPIFADDPDLLLSFNNFETTYSDLKKVKDMIEWLSRAEQNGWFGSDYNNTGWDEICPALKEGKAAMVFIWDTYFTTDFAAGAGKYSAEDFALMPVFMNTENSGTYEGGNLNMMMVPKAAKRREEAIGFLSFCAESEHYNYAFEGISTVNVFQGMTTNIQSSMVTEAMDSIRKHERVSTAATKIIGYNAEDLVKAVKSLFSGESDVSACLKQMDEFRLLEATRQGLYHA